MTAWEAAVERALSERRANGTLRALRAGEAPQAGVDFTSNDYLGLSGHPQIAEAAARAYAEQGSGSKGSRLLGGDPPVFAEAEAALAAWKGAEAALIFNCGYSANVGVLGALALPGAHLFCDRLDHASILDGYALGRAKLHRFAHNSAEDLERALQGAPEGTLKLIAVESVYSMDGDRAPLEAYSALAQHYGALLYVDEAHSDGLLNLKVKPDLSLTTFGKAFGCAGACVFGSRPLIEYLVNFARSFVFSTALPPGAVAAMRASVAVAAAEPWRAQRALALAERFRKGLDALGLDYGASSTQIVPVILGSAEAAMRAQEMLAERGFFVAAVRPPTVPPGTARLRVNLTAAHTEEQVDALLTSISQIVS
jgi:8-amino-7-oxononanoate synthase